MLRKLLKTEATSKIALLSECIHKLHSLQKRVLAADQKSAEKEVSIMKMKIEYENKIQGLEERIAELEEAQSLSGMSSDDDMVKRFFPKKLLGSVSIGGANAATPPSTSSSPRSTSHGHQMPSSHFPSPSQMMGEKRTRGHSQMCPSTTVAAVLEECDVLQYEQVYLQFPVPVAILSLDGRFLTVNDRFVNTTGYAAEHLKQLSFFSLMHKDELEASYAMFDSLLKTEEDEWMVNSSLCFRNKETGDINPKTIRVIIRPIKQHGKPVFFTVALQEKCPNRS